MVIKRRSNQPLPVRSRPTAGHAGFCLAGYMIPTGDAAGGEPPRASPELLRRRAADDARLTSRLGGNLLRSFWSLDSVLTGSPEVWAVAVNTALRPDLFHRSVFLQTLEHRVQQLDRANLALDQLLLAVRNDPAAQFGLDFSRLDAVFDGLDDANRESATRVQIMLALVSAPPRWIIEAPSDRTLAEMGRGYGFASLWDRYVRFHAELYRRVLIRYAVQRPVQTLCALEIFNEPDYNWTPEEVKIEGAGEALINPLGKYVTELQLPQVPTSDRACDAFERSRWGFAPQDSAWAQRRRPPVRVVDFDWGPKFDWYVMCAAQLQSHTARAIKQAAAENGVEVLTVSGSVTHNNIDFLLRMHRGDPAAFEHIDRIGLHPYHWVNNDVWDDRFVSEDSLAGWPSADPQSFARSYFKRFDFLAALRSPSGDVALDAELSAVFGGRKLWLTEFGIGSKVLGDFNAAAPEYTRFIRPRALVGGSGGYPEVIWEDLWVAFLEQVDEAWLHDRGVECLLIYGVRELDRTGLDLDDDDRSNLALFHSDGSPRLDPAVIDRVSGLMQAITQVSVPPLHPPRHPPVPAELYRRPWQAVELPVPATEVKTMLSLEERRLLYWLTSSYYTGAGAIVDSGCFVGGSTVPLAEGLRSTGRAAVIDVFDRFEVEPYMNDFYFKDEGRAAGSSFLPVFEDNLRHLADLVAVHEGDLMNNPWPGGPIEILFIDLSKTWQLNDFIVDRFFPSLIAGRSIVVQQDFVFGGCPWVPLTMEYLSDYFEPVGFAESGSVAYFCRQTVPGDIEPVSEIPHEHRMELMDRSMARFRGYPRSVLECAMAALLIDHGDRQAADAILARVAAEDSQHYPVQAALELLATFH
jgi:hypothetical protein